LIILNIKNNIFTDEFQEKLNNFNSIKEKCIKNIKKYKLDKEEVNEEIKKIIILLDKLKNDISIIEKDKEQAKSYKNFYDENENMKLKLDNYKLNLEKINSLFDRYNEQIEYIKTNKIIEEDIKKIKNSIDEKELSKNEINDEVINITTLINDDKKNINELKLKIEKFKEQVKKEELLKEYQNMIHRDGVPSFLLKNNINIINTEMSNLLSDVADVDFTLFFNDDIQLKMFHNIKPDSCINAVESSGMERTFTALILKFCLRILNNKSKPTFLFMDEITAKLSNGENIRSIDKFIDLLETLKKKIDKIIIIEHIHEVNPDMILNVKKDKEGISYVSF